MNIRNFIFIGCLLFLIACKSEKQKLSEKIISAEKELKNDTTGFMNYKKAIAMGKLYEEYAQKFPDDSGSAKYLYKAADVYAHSHDIKHAVELYGQVIAKYPESKNAPQSLFFIGFLNENELKNFDEARKTYTQLLSQFPNYEQAETVKWLLLNLGKSDEEIVKQFEAMPQNTDSTAGR